MDNKVNNGKNNCINQYISEFISFLEFHHDFFNCTSQFTHNFPVY